MIYKTKFNGVPVEIECGIDSFGEFYVEGAWFMPEQIKLNQHEEHELLSICEANIIEWLGWQFSTPDHETDLAYRGDYE